MLTSNDLEFNPKNHRYKIKDTKPAQYIPSVTTICGMLNKPYLVEWAAREAATAAAYAVAEQDNLNDQILTACIENGRKSHRELREHGASVGSMVHDRIKSRLTDWIDPNLGEPSIEADLAMEAFHQWYTEHVYEVHGEPLHVERIVVHPSGLYCGTFDLLIRNDDGTMTLVDFKTSNQSESNPLAIYPEYFFQVAAYRKAIIDSPEFDVDEIASAQLVALGKDGQLGVTVLDADALDPYTDAFLSMADVYPVYNEAKRRINALNKTEKMARQEVMSHEL